MGSLELAEHLQSITVLRAFVRAHVAAQVQLVNFVGHDGQINTCELARTILESNMEIYKAITLAAREAIGVERSILSGMRLMRANINATLDLSNFIMKANHAGVINSREAEFVLHP